MGDGRKLVPAAPPRSAPTARSSRTDYTVLGCLSLGPMSGYDIKKLIDDSISHFWNESFGQIYPALARLERDGLVIGSSSESTKGRRRREYTLTAEGLRMLRSWLELPAQPDVVRYETSLKLFFGGQMSVEASRAHVLRYREEQVARSSTYREFVAMLQASTKPSPHLPHWMIVLDGGVRYAEMAIAWCDATLERLGRLDPAEYPVQAHPPE